MSKFKEKMAKAFEVYDDMKLLVGMCQNNDSDIDLWDVYWDSFWELNSEFPFGIKSYDPNASCKADIMARYEAISDFMKTMKRERSWLEESEK